MAVDSAMATPRVSRHAPMWREVARFEFQLQRREFLTWIYVAVFFFLTFGYTSSDLVELVTGRGAIAKNAPWALAQAMAGVTAFGQVITTMITATAVMRDVATRQQELLFTTRLSRRDYLLGRWSGALAVMLLVYVAIPVGLLAGSVMPWVERGALLPFDVSAYLRPLSLLVLPNVAVVSALFFTAGALRRSFMAILLLGVGLVALWSTGVSLVRDGTLWGAMIDPFGNAALEAVTRHWGEGERGAREIPIGGWVLANRTLWLAVAGVSLTWLGRAFSFDIVSSTGAAGHAARATRDDDSERPSAPPSATAARGAARLGRGRTLWLEGHWTMRWTLRERGFRTLAALGALNAAANAWRVGATHPDAGVVLAAVAEHSRLFLILVATIYAGELVWRERDVRTDAMRDALPASTGTLLAGRILGLLAAQAVLVAPLLVVGLVVGLATHAAGMSAHLALLWTGGIIWPFLVQLTLLSLLVHAIVQHKVAGHVLLIIGWVLAVAMERTLALPTLARYANLPPYTWSADTGFGGDGARLAWVVVYWSAVAATCGVLASTWWVRGVAPRFIVRASGAARQLHSAHGWLLIAGLTLAAIAGLSATGR